MAITRKYTTKEECVGLFIDDNFDAFPSWVVTEHDSFWGDWEFEDIRDAEDEWMGNEEEEIEGTFGNQCETARFEGWRIPHDLEREIEIMNVEQRDANGELTPEEYVELMEELM